MTDEMNDFRDAANAIAAERYSGEYSRGFAHLAVQVAFPTFGFTDDQAEEIVTVDRRGDLGCDGIQIADEEQQILMFQSKSSASLTDSQLHDYISSFISVPSKLDSDQWLSKAHPDMRALANEYRVAVRNEYQVVYAFATGSIVSDTVRSTFEDLSEVPGTNVPAFIDILDRDTLTSRYRKLLLAEHGRATNVVFTVRSDQWHEPASEEPVIYLTIPAAEYVRACKQFSMELFRYNPRLYLGVNKVNSSIAETLKSDVQRKWFHLLNNGITAVCTQSSRFMRRRLVSTRLRSMTFRS
jgi:AIPR protein